MVSSFEGFAASKESIRAFQLLQNFAPRCSRLSLQSRETLLVAWRLWSLAKYDPAINTFGNQTWVAGKLPINGHIHIIYIYIYIYIYTYIYNKHTYIHIYIYIYIYIHIYIYMYIYRDRERKRKRERERKIITIYFQKIVIIVVIFPLILYYCSVYQFIHRALFLLYNINKIYIYIYIYIYYIIYNS